MRLIIALVLLLWQPLMSEELRITELSNTFVSIESQQNDELVFNKRKPQFNGDELIVRFSAKTASFVRHGKTLFSTRYVKMGRYSCRPESTKKQGLHSLKTPLGTYYANREREHIFGKYTWRLEGYQGRRRGILIHRKLASSTYSKGCISPPIDFLKKLGEYAPGRVKVVILP